MLDLGRNGLSMGMRRGTLGGTIEDIGCLSIQTEALHSTDLQDHNTMLRINARLTEIPPSPERDARALLSTHELSIQNYRASMSAFPAGRATD